MLWKADVFYVWDAQCCKKWPLEVERTRRRQRAERVMFSMREVLLGLGVERDWAGPDLWEGGRYTEREPLSSTVSGYWRAGFFVLTI